MSRIATGADWTLHHGDYATALAGERVSAVICDPPYSARTHVGHDSGSAIPSADYAGGQEKDRAYARRKAEAGVAHRRSLTYDAWGRSEVDGFCDFWAERCDGWIVILTDHLLSTDWAEALDQRGRYVFSPLAFLEPGSRVRMTGDGPAQWSVWIVVARPRREPYSKWGALPGGYVMPKGLDEAEEKREIGGKPVWLLRQLIRDYSRPGDTIADPCMGWCSTGIAAIREGRKFIGSEIRQEAYDESVRRMQKPRQAGLFVPPTIGMQVDLFDAT